MRKKNTIIYSPVPENDFLKVYFTKGNGLGFPMHSHYEFEIHYIDRSVEALRIVSGVQEFVKGKELTFLGSDILHTHRQKPEDPDNNQFDLLIHANPILLQNEIMGFNGMNLISDLINKSKRGLEFGAQTISKAEEILRIMVRDPNLSKPRVLVLFMELIIILAEAQDSRYIMKNSSSDHYMVHDGPIRKSIKYITDNFASKITVAQIAEILGLSSDRANKNFKRATGMNIIEYVNDLRLTKFAHYLLTSDKRISEIAYSVGFDSVSHLNRQFKIKYNCTPLEFKNKTLVHTS